MKTQTLRIILILILVSTLFGTVLIILPKNSQIPKEKQIEVELLSKQTLKLETLEDLDELIERTKNKKYVLLGESSHGTSEYYLWRAKISQRLITENNFSFIAIEGDWPNIYNINRYVKLMDNTFSTGQNSLAMADRWPQWMWANEEFLELVEWVREYNKDLPITKRVGIYGMDMQHPEESINQAIERLLEINSDLGEEISKAYNCLKEYDADMQRYAQAHFSNQVSCQDKTVNALKKFDTVYSEKDVLDSEKLFEIRQNILAVEYAEEYARALVVEDSQSWNTRVNYMKETIGNLSDKYQDNSKGIIWAHNTHVGDAKATQMTEVGMVNIGQLLREKYLQENIFIVGFGTYQGQVIASFQWGGNLQKLNLPKAISGSIESFLKEIKKPSFIFFLDEDNLPQRFTQKLGHRAKGVVYNPAQDQNHYVPTILKDRYDSFIFIKTTTALTPL